MFPVLFCLSLYFCQEDLMAEDKTRHQEKWVKPMVRMVNKVWKGGLLLACFSAWPKVWVDGPESTMENALADDFWLGLAAIVCFLWLSDLCVTQTARGTSAGECLSSSPFVFSLSPLLFSSCLPSFLNTWQKVTGNIGQLEAVKLNLEDSMVCVEDQKKIVQKTPKIGERQLHDMEEKTNKLADRVTAALVIYEEHMSDYHTRLILILHMAWAKNQSNDSKRKNLPNHCARPGCTLAMSWNGNRFTERRWVGGKEMMKSGIDGRARIKKRTRKEAKWKQRTRRDRSVMSRVGHFAHGPAHVQKKKLLWCRRFNTLPCVMPRHVLWIQSVQKHWKMICKMQYNDGVVNVPVVMHWLLPTKKKKGKPESLRKLCEEPDCMCVGANPDQIRLISTTFFSPLLSFFCNTSSEKNPFPLFHFFPPFPKKILLLMFYFSLLKMFYSWPFQSDKIMQFSSWKGSSFFLDCLRVSFVSFFYLLLFQELFRI